MSKRIPQGERRSTAELWGIATGLLLSGASTTLCAQTALEEVVVTARATSESLEKVPVAASVMSEADLARYDSSNLISIAQSIPQVEVYGGGEGNGGSFLIRGMGTTGDDLGLEQSVAINVDGVLVSRPRVLFNSQFDIEQVEVLKGPQALFFGKNSPAGVISFKTVDPGDFVEGYVKAGYEFEAKERYMEGAVGGPLSDTFGVRVAARYSEMDGWMNIGGTPHPDPLNPSVILPGNLQGDGPEIENKAARVTLLFRPTDTFTSKLKYSFSDYSDNDPLGSAEPVCAPGRSHPVVVDFFGNEIPDLQSDCRLDGRVSVTAVPADYLIGADFWKSGIPFSEIKTHLVSWSNVLEVGNNTLISTTGYTALERKGGSNFGRIGFMGAPGATAEDYDSFSQELRWVSDLAGPFNYALGAYYSDTGNKQIVDALFAYVGPAPDGNTISAVKRGRVDAKTMSVFGQVRYQLTDAFELAAGARWTDEEKEVVQGNTYVHPGFLGAISDPSRILDSKFEDDNVSPEVTLTWQPTGTTTVYAAYKTGYKSGGIGLPAILTSTSDIANLTFESEEVSGFELGYKGYALDRRLRLDLTAYFYKFDDLQLSNYNPETVSFSITNASDADQKGIEGSFDLMLTQSLSMRGAFGYNRLEYGSFRDAPCYAYQTAAQGCRLLDPTDPTSRAQDLTGKQLRRAPKFSGTLGVTYEIPLGDALRLTVDADAKYTSEYNIAENANPTAFQDAYWMYNAALRLAAANDQWEIALIGRNLGDERIGGFVQDRATGGPGDVLIYGLRPIEVLLNAAYRF